MPSEMKFAHLPGTDFLPGLIVARVEDYLDLQPAARAGNSCDPASASVLYSLACWEHDDLGKPLIWRI